MGVKSLLPAGAKRNWAAEGQWKAVFHLVVPRIKCPKELNCSQYGLMKEIRSPGLYWGWKPPLRALAINQTNVSETVLMRFNSTLGQVEAVRSLLRLLTSHASP